MAVMDYCIDSDILIDYLRGHEPSRRFFLDTGSRHNLFISAINMVEIYSGRETKNAAKRKRAEEFLENFRRIPVEDNVAKRAGELRRDYNGPFADMIVAATALEYKFTLVTRNVKHYQGMEGLTVFIPY